jgi:hypothetical protein
MVMGKATQSNKAGKIWRIVKRYESRVKREEGIKCMEKRNVRMV